MLSELASMLLTRSVFMFKFWRVFTPDVISFPLSFLSFYFRIIIWVVLVMTPVLYRGISATSTPRKPVLLQLVSEQECSRRKLSDPK